MYRCESWTIKKAGHRRIDAFELWLLEKTLESPLDCKEIQPVHPKGDQFWIFIGRTDAKAEAPILWPLDMKNWLIWKDPDAGKDWRQEEKGMAEGEMLRWHPWFDGHEFEQALGIGDGQGSLAWCSPWSRKELDVTEWLNERFRRLKGIFFFFFIKKSETLEFFVKCCTSEMWVIQLLLVQHTCSVC